MGAQTKTAIADAHSVNPWQPESKHLIGALLAPGTKHTSFLSVFNTERNLEVYLLYTVGSL